MRLYSSIFNVGCLKPLLNRYCVYLLCREANSRRRCILHSRM